MGMVSIIGECGMMVPSREYRHDNVQRNININLKLCSKYEKVTRSWAKRSATNALGKNTERFYLSSSSNLRHSAFSLFPFFINLSVSVWLVVMRCEIKRHNALVRVINGLETRVSVENMNKTRDQHLPSPSARQSGTQEIRSNRETW